MTRLPSLLFVFLLLLVAAAPARTDSVYELDLTRDLVLSGVSTGVFTTSLFLPALIEEQTSVESINGLDSLIMRDYGAVGDTVSTYATYAMLLSPAATALLTLMESSSAAADALTYATMYGQAFVLTYGTKDVLKALVSRHRPYTYAGSVPAGEEDDYYNSFPSGHTAFAFMSATFLARTFADEFPDSRWRVPVAAGAFAAAGAVATLRVTSGNHFITDVLAGAAVGALWGWVIPELHVRR